MTRLVSSLADLTDIRDRDRLELSVAGVLFDLVGPISLAIYRVFEDQGTLRVRTRAYVDVANPVPKCDILTDADSLPPLSALPLLALCYERGAEVMERQSDDSFTLVLPLKCEVATPGHLELRCRKEPSVYQRRLIDGVLRVYCNYIQVLNASLYDQLTGLLNRRSFDEHLFQILAGTRTQGRHQGVERRHGSDGSAWLAVLDIDYFKKINDRFGHQYGDEVLVLLAHLLRRTFREDDRIFRFGGEEFVVVLANAPPNAVAEIMERCRAAVEAFPFPQVGRVTISIGFSMLTSEDTGTSAFGRADEALYAAKEQGRNRAVWHERIVADGLAKSVKQDASEIEFF